MLTASRLLLAKLASNGAKAAARRPRQKKVGAILQISNTISIPFIPGMESLRTYEKAKEQEDLAKRERADAAVNTKTGRGKKKSAPAAAGRTVRAVKNTVKRKKSKANTGAVARRDNSAGQRSRAPRRK